MQLLQNGAKQSKIFYFYYFLFSCHITHVKNQITIYSFCTTNQNGI